VKEGIYYGLDPVGAHIWKLLQTSCKVADIHEVLLREYDVEAERWSTIYSCCSKSSYERG
jgi:Coenzyme PQQ synthesis protein D (PqqD)